MNGKERGHEKAPPRSARQLLQQREDQGRIKGMKQNVDKVMSPRFQTEKLTVQHVRQHGQRMPIGADRVRERPFDPLPAQTAQDMRILGYISLVVEVDEVMVHCRPEHGDGQSR